MERGTEVGDESGIERADKEFLDDGQEVVERTSWWKRGGVRVLDSPPGGREQESMLDDAERDSAYS